MWALLQTSEYQNCSNKPEWKRIDETKIVTRLQDTTNFRQNLENLYLEFSIKVFDKFIKSIVVWNMKIFNLYRIDYK